MLQYNPTVSGSLQVTGTITATQGITGSFSGSVAGFPTDVSAFSASLSTRITATESTSSEYVTTSSSLASRVSLTESTASQYVAASGSLSTRVTATEATASQFVTASGSLSTRTTNTENYITSLHSKTGSYATTGSNYFIGQQVITGSVYISSDLIVQGSSSLQNITASAVSIGTNTVILNTDSPAVRFAGISVRDSGSNSGVTSSIWYDSLNNKWIYQNESGSSYSGGMFISGPRNTGSLGDEEGMANGYIIKGLGGDHIGPSIIFESGSTNIGIGTTSPGSKLEIASSTFQDHLILNRTGVGLMHITATNPRGLAITDGSSQFVTIVQSNGNVGIGVTNPGDLLTVVGTGLYPRITIQSTNAGSSAAGINFADSSGTQWAIAYDKSGGGMQFFREGSGNRMYINNAGNVGIGTTSPSSLLHVNSGTTATQTIANFAAANYSSASSRTYIQIGTQYGDGSSRIGSINTTGNQSALVFQTHAATSDVWNNAMYINGSGNVGIGTTSPSSKLQVGDLANTSGVKNDIFIAGDTVNTNGYYARLIFGNSSQSGGSTASIRGERITSNYATELTFYTNPGGSAGDGTERMRITSGGDVGIGTTSPLQTSSNRIVTTINGTTSVVLNLSTGGTLRSYLYADSGGSTFETVGTNTIAANSTNMISFTTNGTERMQIMSGGAIGFGRSYNNGVLRATLTKTGSTSITFTATLGTVGAWRPGHARIRVTGTQNGLQEYYSAWYDIRVIGYFGSGASADVISSGGSTGSITYSSTSTGSSISPQTLTFTVTDNGNTTDNLIADIDFAYMEGIISLT